MTMPKWLKLEYVGLLLLGTSAAININIVVHDPTQWLHAGLAGASLAWMMSTGVIMAQSRVVERQHALLLEYSMQHNALLELKGREVGEALAARFGGEAAPRVTRH